MKKFKINSDIHIQITQKGYEYLLEKEGVGTQINNPTFEEDFQM